MNIRMGVAIVLVTVGWGTAADAQTPSFQELAAAQTRSWEITRLTNDAITEMSSDISGSNIVWQARNLDTSEDHVFLYDGQTTRQLSDTPEGGRHPAVDGSNVVWEGWDGSDYEIFLWDGTSTTQITNNHFATGDLRVPSDIWADISGSNVVWQGWRRTDWQVFLWNGDQTIQLSSGTADNERVRVSGDSAAWRGHDGHDNEIFLWSNGQVTQLTNDAISQGGPVISVSNVAWWGEGGICLYDGSNTSFISVPSTQNLGLGISGDNMAWQGWDGNDFEVFFYDGQEIINVTDNDLHDADVAIDGYSLVWRTYDQQAWDLYTTTIPEPATMGLLGAGLISLVARRKKVKGR